MGEEGWECEWGGRDVRGCEWRRRDVSGRGRDLSGGGGNCE